jgi:hypothetical protein
MKHRLKGGRVARERSLLWEFSIVDYRLYAEALCRFT